MEKKTDLWTEKANLATLMFVVLGLVYPYQIINRFLVFSSYLIKELELGFTSFGFFIVLVFWFKTVNLFESHPRLEMLYIKTLNILPWIFLSFSLIHQFIRLYYHLLPNIGVTRTVLLLEGFYVLAVFLFGLAFYRIDLFAKINLVRMLSKRREDRSYRP